MNKLIDLMETKSLYADGTHEGKLDYLYKVFMLCFNNISTDISTAVYKEHSVLGVRFKSKCPVYPTRVQQIKNLGKSILFMAGDDINKNRKMTEITLALIKLDYIKATPSVLVTGF